MTVCLGAIASWDERRPVLVYAADRMITSRKTHEYELLDQTKLYPLADHVKILVSGDLDALLPVCQETDVAAREQRLTRVSDMAALFADRFQAHRRHVVERLHFQPYNLSIDDFVSRQKEFVPEFRDRLGSAIDDPADDLGEVLMLGIDEDGAHIFTIRDPGWERSWDATGFAAIGIGAEHAESVFISSNYTPSRDWVSAMVSTFFAKKAAENAPGVGPATDLYYLTEGGEIYFEPQSAVVRELDKMYLKTRADEFAALMHDGRALAGLLAKEQGATEATPQAAQGQTEHPEANSSETPSNHVEG